MSHSASDNRAFFDAVQDYFLERTGRGLVLSSRDLELLLDWRHHGASAAAVCQGIDEAVESLNKAPRDLHACRRYVEPRIDRDRAVIHRRPQSSRAPASDSRNDDEGLWSEVRQRLDEAIEGSERPEVRSAYARARGRVQEAAAASNDPYAMLYDLDDWLVDTVFENLAEDERRLLDMEIEARHGAHLGMMTDEARAQTVRSSRRDLLTDRLGLISLVG